MSRAAKRLHITQPGLSGALARLRELLDDPVLVRVGREMQPTPRAEALLGPVREALSLLQSVTEPAPRFQPRESDRIFTLGLVDGHEMAFTAPILARLALEAPRARLVIRPIDVYSMRAALDEEEIDAAIAVDREIPSWHCHDLLFLQRYACVWDPSSLPIEAPLTPQRYAELPHLLVTFKGDLTGPVDDALAEHGLSRRVVCGVPRFASLPSLLAALPAVATVPAPVARILVRRARLRSCAPPVAIAPRRVGLVYRQQDASRPELVWFREVVRRSVEDTLKDDEI